MSFNEKQSKEISFTDNKHDTHKIISEVLLTVQNIISPTIGPKGSFSIGDFDNNVSQIINDGVTIINNLKFTQNNSSMYNLILERVKSCTQNVNELVGDGTSTCAIMIAKLYEIGMQYSKLQHSALISKGMHLALQKMLQYIKNNSLPINNIQDIIDIATVSSRKESIGKMIGEAIEKIGREGSILCTEGNALETTLEISQGFKVECGAISSIFLKRKNKISFKNVRILVTNYIISNFEQLVKIIEEYNKVISTSEDNGLVIFVKDLNGAALQVASAANQNRSIVFVKLPAIEEEETINDLLAVLSVKIDSETQSRKYFDKSKYGWDKLNETFFLLSEHIEISLKSCVIISNNDSSESVLERINELKSNLENEEIMDYKKKQIKERISRLSGGIANIRIGGINEKDIKDQKYLVQDAISATQSAIETGVVCGGGIFYMELAEELKVYIDELVKNDTATGIIDGVKTVIESLYAPLQSIIQNTNISFDFVISKLGINHSNILNKFENLNKNLGFNANTEEFCDLLKNGVKEAAKVPQKVLENSISLACSLLQTNSIIIYKDNDQ